MPSIEETAASQGRSRATARRAVYTSEPRERGPIVGKVLGIVVLIVVLAVGAVMFVPSVRARVVGVPLKLQYAEGQETRTKTVLEGKIRLDVSGLPDNVLPKEAGAMFNSDIPFKMETRALQVVKSVSKDTVEVESSSDGGTLELKLPGSPAPATYPIPPSPAARVKLDPNGRVQPEIPATTEGLTPRDVRRVQDFIGTLATASLPGDTRRVGATWPTNVNLDLESKLMKAVLKGTVTNTFQQITQKNAVTVADISGTQDLSIDLRMGPGDFDVNLMGTMKGVNSCYLDWNVGQVVLTDGNTHLDLTLSVKTQKPQPMDAKAHVVGDVKMTVERL